MAEAGGAGVRVAGSAYARLLDVDVGQLLEQAQAGRWFRPPWSAIPIPRARRIAENLGRRVLYVGITCWRCRCGSPPATFDGSATPSPSTASLDVIPAAVPVTPSTAGAEAVAPEAATAPASKPAATPYVASLAPVPRPAPAPAAAGNALEMQFSGDSWVDIGGPDGSTVEKALIRSGETRSFTPGQVTRVTLGNASAVQVQQNGAIVDLTPTSEPTWHAFRYPLKAPLSRFRTGGAVSPPSIIPMVPPDGRGESTHGDRRSARTSTNSERVRSWLWKNGASILGGEVIAIGAIAGWQWYQDQGGKLASANVEVPEGPCRACSRTLTTPPRRSRRSKPARPASTATSRQLAKAQVDAGKNEEALATLRNVKVEGDLQRVVDQRVARLLVATGKSDEAIKLLGSATDSSSLEIHGDALMAQGKRDDARAQYEKALKTLDVRSAGRLLETKVMDAGGTVAAPAESV